MGQSGTASVKPKNQGRYLAWPRRKRPTTKAWNILEMTMYPIREARLIKSIYLRILTTFRKFSLAQFLQYPGNGSPTRAIINVKLPHSSGMVPAFLYIVDLHSSLLVCFA